MKHISNNSPNSVSFVNDMRVLSDGSNLVFYQIGANASKQVAVTFIEEDCFVSTFSIVLGDFTPNGLYKISLLDSNRNILAADSAVVDGMLEDNKRAYIIEDIVSIVEETNKLTMKLNGKL